MNLWIQYRHSRTVANYQIIARDEVSCSTGKITTKGLGTVIRANGDDPRGDITLVVLQRWDVQIYEPQEAENALELCQVINKVKSTVPQKPYLYTIVTS